MKYKSHNLCEPRTYTVHCGYGNAGEYEHFFDLLMSMGQQLLEDKPKEKAPYTQIMGLYRSLCTSFPTLARITDKRMKAIKARWNEYKDIDKFIILFNKAEASSFLKGQNNRKWKANFDWLLNENNMAKVLEGNYDDKPGMDNGKALSAQERNRSVLEDMLARELYKNGN